jgi:hypothetical protein
MSSKEILNKKADFTYFLKNKEWLKKHEEQIEKIDSRIKNFVDQDDLERLTELMEGINK